MNATLFDAIEAREEAIARAERHANEQWKQDAYEAVVYCSNIYETFTADEVWAVLEELSESSTHEPSARGPVFRQAAREGLIVKCGLRPTRLARRHREITVWRAA